MQKEISKLKPLEGLKFPVFPLKTVTYPVRVTGRRRKTEFFSVVNGESALLADVCVHFSGVLSGFWFRYT